MKTAAWIALVVLGFVFLGADSGSLHRAVRNADERGEEWGGEHPAGLRCFFLGLACFAAAAFVNAL